MIIVYDGSFEGLLTGIFEAFRLKHKIFSIVPENLYEPSLFSEEVFIETSRDMANRVRKGIIERGSRKSFQLLYRTFLSEYPEISMLIYQFVRKSMNSVVDITNDYSDPDVLKLHQINKQIGREVHRMHAFIRFQKTKDDIFFSVIEPDFNVIPLLPSHFRKRYASQQWLIYDIKRKYGIFYDLKEVDYITFSSEDHDNLKSIDQAVFDVEEIDYQNLWKSYFDSVNIPERRNMKLHLKHVPKRYWKYLTEKSIK